MNRRRFLELMLGGAALVVTQKVTKVVPVTMEVGEWRGITFRESPFDSEQWQAWRSRAEPMALSTIRKAIDWVREHNVPPDANGDYWAVLAPD